MQNTKTFKRVFGGGIAAATLAGAAVVAQAPAASASEWDQLAECESGGDWSINTGNGFYGGLQFTQQSWQAAGGSGLPSDASKAEQIDRAQTLHGMQGWGAWPSCSSQLGLSGTPGGSESASAEQETEAPAQDQQVEEAPVEEAPAEQAPVEEAPVEQAPVEEAPVEEAPVEQAPVEQAPVEQAPVEQAPVEQAPVEQAPVEQAPVEQAPTSGETHTVSAGETLASIADQYGLSWKDLHAANGDTIEDPNLIFVGDELQIP